jgi:LuxR family maltose regulon positive regulatory protein
VELLVRDLPDEIREVFACTRARLWLAQGRPEQARQQLAPLEAQLHHGGRLARLITVYTLQALTHAALGQPEEARTFLAAAIGIAAPEGYLRRLLDEGPAVVPLLPAVRNHAPAFVDQLQQAFHDQVLRAAPSPAGSAAAAPPVDIPLTQQEQIILRMLADGFSYRAIAEQLVISVGTVRWHVHNLYGKLGVANRTQSINRARVLGLL